MLTIQYVVDVSVITPDDCTPVHYTFENLVDVNANVLVLAGTVGDPYTPMYASFLQWCANRMSQVLVVSNGKVSTEYMEKLIKRVNTNSCYGIVYYLHNTTIEISNIVFGCFDDENVLSAKIHEAKIAAADMYGDDTRYVVATLHGLSPDMVNSVDYVIGGVKSASYNKHDALITVPTGVPVWMK